MVKDKGRMWLDLLVLSGVIVGLYYLRSQNGGIGPYEGFQSFVSIFK